jgi:y4mF family transcriptional regulator
MSQVKSIVPKLHPASLLKAAISLGKALSPAATKVRSRTIYDEVRGSRETTIQTAKDLGEIIHNVRKSKGLTQQQLADLVGVGRRFIIECEMGKPRLEFAKVLQVAAASGIDLVAKKR